MKNDAAGGILSSTTTKVSGRSSPSYSRGSVTPPGVSRAARFWRRSPSEPPAVILLDVQLPGLNGYEVCRALRDRYGDSIAIIFISGERTDPLDRGGGMLIGADDYLVKPCRSR